MAQGKEDRPSILSVDEPHDPEDAWEDALVRGADRGLARLRERKKAEKKAGYSSLLLTKSPSLFPVQFSNTRDERISLHGVERLGLKPASPIDHIVVLGVIRTGQRI